MAAPKLTLTVQDGGLGSAINTDRLIACFGVSSDGDAGTLAQFTDPASLVAAYGYGPGVSLALHVLETSGQPVIFGKASNDEDAIYGAVTKDGTGASTMTYAKTDGTKDCFDSYEVIVTIATGGTAGTTLCRATVSIDGGTTSLGTFAITTSARTIVIPKTNITCTFSAATLVAGDTYSFSVVAPRSTALGDTAGNLTQLIEQLQVFAAQNGGIYPSVIVDADYRSAANVTTIQAKLEAAALGYEYARLITSARPADTEGGETQAEWAADISDDFASTNAIRVCVGAGLAKVLDPATSAYLWRTNAFALGSRAAGTQVHLDPAWVAIGASPRILEVSYDERTRGALPSLDNARFSTMTTQVGLTGYYITNGRLMAPPGSDYQYIQYGRVMDKICRTTYGFFILRLSQNVRLNAGTGYILETDAQQIEQGATARLKSTVLSDGNVSAIACTVSRTDNLSIPGAPFHATVRAVPLGYLKQIDINLFFSATL